MCVLHILPLFKSILFHRFNSQNSYSDKFICKHMEETGHVLDIRVKFTLLLSLCAHAFEFVCAREHMVRVRASRQSSKCSSQSESREAPSRLRRKVPSRLGSVLQHYQQKELKKSPNGERTSL